MRVSLNSIKSYTEVDLPLPELISRINQQLGGVEEVVDLAARYRDARIVRIADARQHPDADRLTVCLIDDNGQRDGVERNSDGLIEVVCGAPNVRVGMLAVWLPPGSTVPASYADEQPFVLSSRKLRGVMSNGMLAAGDELAINSDHEGIIDITENDLPTGMSIDGLVGASFAEVFGLNDTLIDIENKMFTHRPDLFGQLGVAREVFAITQPATEQSGSDQVGFNEPDWYQNAPVFESASGLELDVFNHVITGSPRFMAVAIKDVEVKPSPLWLQVELMRLGGKPVNNIVDLTNYVMLLTAQPTHAYDYDKLRGHQIGVRLAQPGEQIELLNGKTYQLDEADLVIADSEGVIGLAGVMGGLNSEVSDETKNIVLEVANFDMYMVRRTSMRHGLFTDAVTRFNKGQSRFQADRVLGRLLDLLPGSQASQVYDLGDHESSTRAELRVGAEFINQRLGLGLSIDEIARILRYVNFEVHESADQSGSLDIAAPFWRTDIELPEDIVEEVGRLYGFDKLPRELPQRSIRPAEKNPMRELKQQLRDSLSRAGANEVLSYSFVHQKVLLGASQDPADSYRLSNSLSPDLQYYRQSLTPSLLKSVHPNIKAGYSKFGLFEIGRGHQKSLGLDAQAVPNEVDRLALVVAAKKPEAGAAYYLARRYLEQLAIDLKIDLRVEPLLGDVNALEAPYEPVRSGRVVEVGTGRVVGVVGEFNGVAKKAFKLPDWSAGFEIDLDAVLSLTVEATSSYRPLSRFPSLNRDISLRLGVDVDYQSVLSAVRQADLGEVESEITLLGIYQAEDDLDHKNITFRVRLTNYSRTLTADDADVAMAAIASQVTSGFGAEVV